MGVPEMKQIGQLISRAIKDGGDETKAKAIASDVHDLTAKFPVYPR